MNRKGYWQTRYNFGGENDPNKQKLTCPHCGSNTFFYPESGKPLMDNGDTATCDACSLPFTVTGNCWKEAQP